MVQAHHGRVFKTSEDGVLVEFSSPLEAVRCAIEVQRRLSHPRALRGPLNSFECALGSTLETFFAEGDGELFGDGVNIAVRLEQLADSGGIILSGRVYEEVRDKLGGGLV